MQDGKPTEPDFEISVWIKLNKPIPKLCNFERGWF